MKNVITTLIILALFVACRSGTESRGNGLDGLKSEYNALAQSYDSIISSVPEYDRGSIAHAGAIITKLRASIDDAISKNDSSKVSVLLTELQREINSIEYP